MRTRRGSAGTSVLWDLQNRPRNESRHVIKDWLAIHPKRTKRSSMGVVTRPRSYTYEELSDPVSSYEAPPRAASPDCAAPDRSEISPALEYHRAFATFSDEQIRKAIVALVEKPCKKGEIIIEEGEDRADVRCKRVGAGKKFGGKNIMRFGQKEPGNSRFG